MTSPTPFQSGQYLFPHRLNRPWTTYTPSWTSTGTWPTLGNGVLLGKWRYLDEERVHIRIALRPGSTTTFGTGQYQFWLPPGIPAAAGAPDPTLDAVALMGGALYKFLGWANTATASADRLNMYRPNINTQENLASWTNTLPVAFANGHSFSMSGYYYYA
ncbi:hypothetical protein [Micromonospora thermarum]|uniref:Uncharacterized protein n=1 Tax=Micromonospora thermarum TaxID=2720024 RepID=A0ABX0Z983_9ACTN|nr:hypothetical protein [Micromonospora thermarum]NJP33678.1 hypothetical protein [Micromonospora thermarum]